LGAAHRDQSYRHNSSRGLSAPAIEIPAFQSAGADPATWIKPSDAPLTFHTVGQKKDVTLMPINSLFDKRYSVYWTVS
jgi:hypothetical protein